MAESVRRRIIGFTPKARMLFHGKVSPIAAIDVTRQKRDNGAVI